MTTTYAPDGTPIEAFVVLPPGPAPAIVDAALAKRPSTVLDLGSGAGRIAHPLIALGHELTCVDQCPEILAHVRGATTHLADIETLDLGVRFDAVLLASFLVNTPDVDQRAAFLATAARHVEPGGQVLVQRLDPELVPIAVDADSAADGVIYEMRDVTHDNDTFEATMRFTIGADTWEHRYRGAVLGDTEFDDALTVAGLRRVRFLDDQRTWVEATR